MTFATLTALGTLLASPLASLGGAGPELALVSVTPACGETFFTGPSDSPARLVFSGLGVMAGADEHYVSRVCEIVLAPSVPYGHRLESTAVTLQGAATVEAGGDTDVTVRVFPAGAASEPAFLSFTTPGAHAVSVEARGPVTPLACDAAPLLHVTLDLSAATAASLRLDQLTIAPLRYVRCENESRGTP